MGDGSTMSADKIVVWTTIACSAFALGLSTGQSAPVACPDKLQGERLISTITTGNVTTCAYGVSYGRAITKRTKL